MSARERMRDLASTTAVMTFDAGVRAVIRILRDNLPLGSEGLTEGHITPAEMVWLRATRKKLHGRKDVGRQFATPRKRKVPRV